MSINKLELQSLLIQTRTFLQQTIEFIEKRNHTLATTARDGTLHMNWAVGDTIKQNLEHADLKLQNQAYALGIASTEGYRQRFIVTLPTKIKNFILGRSDKDNQAAFRKTADYIHQTLLRTQEWLTLEAEIMDTVAKAIPAKPHKKFSGAHIPSLDDLNDLIEFSKDVTATDTPIAQRKSYFSQDSLLAMLFIKIRANWHGLKGIDDKFKEEFKSEDAFAAESKRVIKQAKLTLTELDIEALVEKLKPETKRTWRLIRDNEAIEAFMPKQPLHAQLHLFTDAQNRLADSGAISKDDGAGAGAELDVEAIEDDAAGDKPGTLEFKPEDLDDVVSLNKMPVPKGWRKRAGR